MKRQRSRNSSIQRSCAAYILRFHNADARYIPVPIGYCTTLCAPSRPDAWCAFARLFDRQYPADLAKFAIATGGSAMKAVEVLMEHGVPEERIIFINLVRSSPYSLPLVISALLTCFKRSPPRKASAPSAANTPRSASYVHHHLPYFPDHPQHIILCSPPDHRLDRQRPEREDVHHPWSGRLRRETVRLGYVCTAHRSNSSPV